MYRTRSSVTGQIGYKEIENSYIPSNPCFCLHTLISLVQIPLKGSMLDPIWEHCKKKWCHLFQHPPKMGIIFFKPMQHPSPNPFVIPSTQTSKCYFPKHIWTLFITLLFHQISSFAFYTNSKAIDKFSSWTFIPVTSSGINFRVGRLKNHKLMAEKWHSFT